MNIEISGVPYAKSKKRRHVDGPNNWAEKIIEKTKDLPTVDGPCVLRVTFLMPPDKFPPGFPFEPDLGNYLKRFQDALNKTVFKNAPGGDSCIMLLEAGKVKASSYDETGIYYIEVLLHATA